MYIFKVTVFVASLVIGKKISSFGFFHSTHYSNPIKMRHT
jgi:hypothetical protein